ncbi:aminotransferase class V-fold PLP-dependent enzyme [Sporomusa sphaeroides]|uniref:cysteine desulfurase n=1 Tax=Sporomusa sphaeroides DSM 2875 TaxID=1337886 RepID=A0ABP2C141_9FIRM|nr:aminotransferase class V-fold PLP-dependent enzyme [Sporomusa sphaeroides]OLS57310.1 putative cysteine desulfurase [Sporomusa sphaeroides DSM 2875]CVK18132.1 putative cysteine desulfurase [Sporomusa sphaeroides DSM 2875]
MAMIYFDNAATSLPKPPAVGQAVLAAINTFGGAGRGGHPAALAASRCLFQARKAVAGLLGSAADRTVFTANATDSLNIAIAGLLTREDHVITTALEHNSVLRPLYKLRSQGMGLSIVDIDQQGNLDCDGFRRLLRPNSKAVVCTHASNLTGTLTDLAFLADFCRENGLLLIVDAAQTAGVFPLDMDKLGIDVLCFTGHKGLLGPQGTGGLCIRQGLAVQPLKVGGSGLHSYSETHPADLPEALEAGTANAHGIAGLLAGVEYIQATGMDTIRDRELELATLFRQGIAAIPGVRIYGDPARPHAPLVTLNIGSLDSGEVGDRLATLYDICVRSGAHCAPLAHLALGTRSQGAVRFSFSSFNTEEEIQRGIRAIAAIAAEEEQG